MKIYFGGAIRGGRDDAALYAGIIEELKRHGDVLTEHVGDSALLIEDEQRSDSEIFERDRTWLDEADYIILEVTQPSLGVGWEAAYAELGSKSPVLCLFRPSSGKRLSAMIRGNSWIRVLEYETVQDAKRIFEELFLER